VGWSTREVADLAGTTVNTVRHYHRTGLLDEPERTSNGYKQYGVNHLVRLLQIRRLRDLGIPLAQIESMDFGGAAAASSLHTVDAELAASIERLSRARAEIRAILEASAGADVPAGFQHLADRLSDADRSLTLVYAQLYDESALTDLKKMTESDTGGADVEFDSLPADADEAARQSLAEALGPQIAQHLIDYPWLADPANAHLTKGTRVTQDTFVEAVAGLYNEAQLDVMGRVSIIATRLAAERGSPGDHEG
jgi:DNA-binding transcriptional MerR regulator